MRFVGVLNEQYGVLCEWVKTATVVLLRVFVLISIVVQPSHPADLGTQAAGVLPLTLSTHLPECRMGGRHAEPYHLPSAACW